MSGAYMQTVAHLALLQGLLGGVVVGWAFADVIETFRRKP